MNAPLASPHTGLRREILATNCLCCGKPLCDAESATLGLGPVCRKRLRFTDSRKAHTKANELIARAAIAAETWQLTTVLECLTALVALDARYQALVDRTHARLFKTRVSRVPEGYVVMSTYNADTNGLFKRRGMRWDPVRRGWLASDRDQLDGALEALGDALPGSEVLGPDGEVISLVERGYQL